KPGTIGTWSSGWTQQITFGTPGGSAYGDEIAGCPSWVPTVAVYDYAAATQYPCASKNDTANPGKGCVDVETGMDEGNTKSGVNELVGLDSEATWDPNGGLDGQGGVTGGCGDTEAGCEGVNPTGMNFSPRIVPIAMFDTQAYYDEVTSNACNGTNCVAKVVSLVGFFLEGMCNDVYPNEATRPPYCGTNSEAKKTVVGRLMKYPGVFTGGNTV